MIMPGLSCKPIKKRLHIILSKKGRFAISKQTFAFEFTIKNVKFCAAHKNISPPPTFF